MDSAETFPRPEAARTAPAVVDVACVEDEVDLSGDEAAPSVSSSCDSSSTADSVAAVAQKATRAGSSKVGQEEVVADGAETERTRDQLKCSWWVWARLQGSTMQIHKFHTVEECQRLFSKSRSPTAIVPELVVNDLEVGDAVELLVFKEGIMPAEETCEDGGHWVAETSGLPSETCNDLWLNLVIAVILAVDMGGQRIIGATVACQGAKTEMAMWMRGQEADHVLPAGKAFQQLLTGFGYSGKILFQSFGCGPSLEICCSTRATTPPAEAATAEQHGTGTQESCASAAQKVVAVHHDTGQEDEDRDCSRYFLAVALPGAAAVRGYQVEVRNTFIDDIVPVEELAAAETGTLQRWRSV